MPNTGTFVFAHLRSDLATVGFPASWLEREPVETGRGLFEPPWSAANVTTSDAISRSRRLVYHDTKQSRVNASSGLQAW